VTDTLDDNLAQVAAAEVKDVPKAKRRDPRDIGIDSNIDRRERYRGDILGQLNFALKEYEAASMRVERAARELSTANTLEYQAKLRVDELMPKVTALCKIRREKGNVYAIIEDKEEPL